MKASSSEKIKLIRSWIKPGTALYKSFNRVINAIMIDDPEDEVTERRIAAANFRASVCGDDADIVSPVFTPREKSLGAFSEQHIFCLQQIQWQNGHSYGPRIQRDILPLIDLIQRAADSNLQRR